MRRRSTPILCVAALAGLAAPVCGAAENPDPAGIEKLIARCRSAYVFVGGGSGALISADGYVITNAHVTRGSKRWKLRTPDGEYHVARVVGFSPGTDLCLLKMDHAENMPCLPLGDSDKLDVGDLVIAIGNPFALGNIDGKPTVTLGVVSALHVDRPYAYDAVQTDTPINPGNSGGPLINMKGELVGVNAQIQTRFGLRQNTGVGYAISSNQVKRFLPALKTAEGKAVATGRIAGIVLDPTKPDGPAAVKQVRPGSKAAQAGIRKGDVICGVDRAPIGSVRDYAGALGRYPMGIEVTLRVRRPRGPDEAPEDRAFKVPIEKHGAPYLGFKFNLKDHRSMRIDWVDPAGAAATAGIKTGDTLIGYVAGNRVVPIRSRRLYYRLLRQVHPGMTVQFVVRRGKANRRVRLVVGERN